MRETTRTVSEGEERAIEDHTTKQDHIIITVGSQHHDVTVDVDRTHLDMVGAYVTTMATTNINTEEEETDMAGAHMVIDNTDEIMTNAHIIADNSTQDMTEAHIVTDNTDVMMQAHIITENTTQAHIISDSTTHSLTQGHTVTNNTPLSNTIQGHINIMEEDRQVDTLETHAHIPTVPPDGQGSNVGGKQTPSVVVLRVMDSYTRSLPQQHNHCGTMLSPQHYHSVTGLLPSPQHHQITSFSDMSLSPPGIVDDLVTININNINSTLTSGHLEDLHNDSLGDPISDSICVNNSASSSSDTLVSHHHQVLDTQTTLASTSNSLTSHQEHHILDTPSSLIPQHIIATPSSDSVNSHHNVISVSPCTCDIIDTNLPNLSTCSCEESNDGFLNCGDVESPGFARDSISINDGGSDSSGVIGSNSELVSTISNICNSKKIHQRKSDCIMVKGKDTDAHCTLPTVPTDTVLISRELDDGKCVRYGTIRVVESGKGATVAGSKNGSNSSIMVSRKRKPVLDSVSSKSCNSDILIKRHIGGDPSTNGEDFVTIDGRRLLAEHTSQTTQNEEKGVGSSERRHFYCCCLCGNVIAQRNKPTLIPRSGVFPLSSLDLVSLLKNLGVCPASLDNSTDTSTITSTNTEDTEPSDGGSFTLCLWCHSLVLEADGVYAQVVSLTARIRHQWLKDGSRSEGLMHLSQLNTDTTHGVARKLKRRNQDISGTKMADIRLNRMKSNGPRVLRKSRNSQTTALPTPDALADDRQVVSPMRESEGITAATTTIKQELSNKMLICGFCGMDLYGDDDFRLHSAAVHRIRPTWQQWANQQSVLKTRLAKEIQRSDPSGRNRDSGRRGGGGGGRESPRKCTACGREYPVREEFVEHLRHYHNMTIDEQFLEFVAEESTGSVSKRAWSGGGGGGGGCQDQGFNEAWSSSSSSSGGSYQETSSGINKDQTNGRTGQVGSVTGTISIIKCEATRPDEEVSSEQDGPLEVKGPPEDKATRPTTIKVEKDHSPLRKQDSVTGNGQYISQTTNKICISPSILAQNRVTTSETPISKNNAMSKLSHSPSSIVPDGCHNSGPEASASVIDIPPSTTTSQPGSKHRQWRCRLCSLIFTSQEQHDHHKLLVHPEAVRVGRCRVSVEKDGRLAFLSKVADKNKILLSKVKNTSQAAFFSKVETKGQPTFLGRVNNSPPKFIKAIGSVSCKLCGTEVEEEDGSKHRILCGTCQENSVVMFEGDNRDGLKQDQIQIFKGDITEEEGVKELETLLVEKRIDGGEEGAQEKLEEAECVSVVEIESGKKPPEVDTKLMGAVGRNFECSACGEIFAHRPLLLEHKRSVHSQTSGGIGGVGKVECEICGWKLQSVTSLRLHLAKVHHRRSTHKLPLRHRCKLCIFQCRTRTQLERHMQEKHGASALPPVRCTECGKTYNAKYIEKHIANMHENLKKYSCNFCSMKYNLETALKSHIFYEHRNNKWWCEVCQVEFDRYHQLRQHRTYVHSTKVYPCRECERSFKRKGDLTEHIKRRHQTRVPNKCIHCTKVYSDRKKLRTHLMTKHGVAWEDTLARTYARHQRESNCFRRKPGPTTTARQTHQHQDQNTSLGPTTEHTQEPQDDNPGPGGGYSEILEVPRKDGMETDEASMTTYEEATTSLVDGGEHQYNVVHVTEDSQHHISHMANFSYIILEET